MKNNVMKIVKPSDALLPATLLLVSVLGRATIALWLFISYCAVKLCALATSDGLRCAFARQPSMRSVQGSALLSLALQFPGALIAALLARLTRQPAPVYPLIGCGLLLNIEQVFYEYLFALGDDKSASLYRFITSLMALMGLMLCTPPSRNMSLPAAIEAVWPLATCGIGAAVGLAVCLLLGGRFEPRINGEALRCCPSSMLRVALYPALALILLPLLAPTVFPAQSLFCGLILYELCRSPFRRTPTESWPMNRVLLITCIAASVLAAACYGFPISRFTPVVLMACVALLLAAVCAFALFGNISRRPKA